MWHVDTRDFQDAVIVKVRGFPGSDDGRVSGLVKDLLEDGRVDVILDLRGVTRFSSTFLGSLMSILVFLHKRLSRHVPMIVTREAKETVFKILPCMGLPWRLFESEADAIEHVRMRSR